MAKEGKRAGVVHGVLNVNKPTGWTSHDVVAKLRGLLGGVKVGHGGTLDPTATGVLPILIGRATRIAEYLLEWDKEYHAVMRLGESTDTQDATGTVLSRRPIDHLTPEALREAAARFCGRITQVPPMYSAVKIGGMPLYKAARAGKTVERSPREAMIYELEILDVQESTVAFRVRCSKGTYVRTLCADIGSALGTGGHLLHLERTRVGPLTIDESMTLEDLSARSRNGRLNELILSLDQALCHLPALIVTEAAAVRARHGVPIPVEAVEIVSDGSISGVPIRRPLRLKERNGSLLGLGMVNDEQGMCATIRIIKVLADDPPSADALHL